MNKIETLHGHLTGEIVNGLILIKIRKKEEVTAVSSFSVEDEEITISSASLKTSKNYTRKVSNETVYQTHDLQQILRNVEIDGKIRPGWYIHNKINVFIALLKKELDQEILDLLFSANAPTMEHYNLVVSDPFARDLLFSRKWLTFRAYAAWRISVHPCQRMGSYINAYKRQHGKSIWTHDVPQFSLRTKNTNNDWYLFVGILHEGYQKGMLNDLIRIGSIYADQTFECSRAVALDRLVEAKYERSKLLETIRKVKTEAYLDYRDRDRLYDLPVRLALKVLNAKQLTKYVDPLITGKAGSQKEIRKIWAKAPADATLGSALSQYIVVIFELFTPEPNAETLRSQWIVRKHAQLTKSREHRGHHYAYVSRLDEIEECDILDVNSSVETVLENAVHRQSMKKIAEYDTEGVPQIVVHTPNCVHLNKFLDVVIEGHRMGHCVGAYTDKVHAGTYEVYHINDGTEYGTTLGINVSQGVDGGIKRRMDQHYGFHNSEPSDTAKLIAKKVIFELEAEKATRFRV